MNGELISRKTRNAFREFLVGWTLRKIEMVFEAAYVSFDRDFDPKQSGERRSFVEQHYHTLDFTSPADVRRLLTAYQDILETATRNLLDSDDKEAAQRPIENLTACLRKDGFKYEDGKITPTTPEARRAFDDVALGNSVSEITRRNILDALRADEMSWSGRLSETEFLGRLYDLDGLPSHDPRFKSAKDDIWQHRVNNPNDWPDDWVFEDARFDLLHAPDEVFLRFLCEMIHPAVRADDGEVAAFLDLSNRHLAADGWEIAAKTQVSGKPVFAAQRRVVDRSPILGAASEEHLSRLWQPGFFRLFLSHKADHKKFAGELKEELGLYGVSCFVAHEDIEPTREWQNEIETALFSMHALVALLTKGFSDSNWTDQEVGVAIGRGVPVIPVRRGLDPYGFIGKYQALTGHKKKAGELTKELYEILWAMPRLKEQLTESLVSRFEGAESFSHANTLMGYLDDKIERVSPALIERLDKAQGNNSQVREAFSVQSRLPGLLKRLRRGGNAVS